MKLTGGENGVPLPENFPKDVPLFKDALVFTAMTAGDTLQVGLSFKASLEEGMQFYEEKLKSEGWEVSAIKMEGVNMLMGKKDQRQCTIRFSKEDKLTVAVISTPVAGK